MSAAGSCNRPTTTPTAAAVAATAACCSEATSPTTASATQVATTTSAAATTAPAGGGQRRLRQVRADEASSVEKRKCQREKQQQQQQQLKHQQQQELLATPARQTSAIAHLVAAGMSPKDMESHDEMLQNPYPLVATSRVAPSTAPTITTTTTTMATQPIRLADALPLDAPAQPADAAEALCGPASGIGIVNAMKTSKGARSSSSDDDSLSNNSCSSAEGSAAAAGAGTIKSTNAGQRTAAATTNLIGQMINDVSKTINSHEVNRDCGLIQSPTITTTTTRTSPTTTKEAATTSALPSFDRSGTYALVAAAGNPDEVLFTAAHDHPHGGAFSGGDHRRDDVVTALAGDFPTTGMCGVVRTSAAAIDARTAMTKTRRLSRSPGGERPEGFVDPKEGVTNAKDVPAKEEGEEKGVVSAATAALQEAATIRAPSTFIANMITTRPAKQRRTGAPPTTNLTQPYPSVALQSQGGSDGGGASGAPQNAQPTMGTAAVAAAVPATLGTTLPVSKLLTTATLLTTTTTVQATPPPPPPMSTMQNEPLREPAPPQRARRQQQLHAAAPQSQSPCSHTLTAVAAAAARTPALAIGRNDARAAAAATTTTTTKTITNPAAAIELTSLSFASSPPLRALPAVGVAAPTAEQQQRKTTTENKCPSKELMKVSNQRELAACGRSVGESHSRQLDKITTGEKLSDNDEYIEIGTSPNTSTHLAEQQVEFLAVGLQTHNKADPLSRLQQDNAATTLAQRNALLRREFFTEQRSENEPSNLPEARLQPNRARANLKLFIPERVRLYSVSPPPPPPESTVLRSPTAATGTQSVPPTRSLVAQRKLDLNRRCAQANAAQEQQRRPRPNDGISGCGRLGIFSASVKDRVRQFDAPALRGESSSRSSPSNYKMIVQPVEGATPTTVAPTTTTTAATLKPDSNQEQRQSPLSDEGCNLGQSPYSSDNEDNESIRTTSTTIDRFKRKERVARSASSDSALGLEVDESMALDGSVGGPALPPPVGQQQQRRNTLTVTDLPLRPALLPLAEPTALPDTNMVGANIACAAASPPTGGMISPTSVPSKVLLEERVVEMPMQMPLAGDDAHHHHPPMHQRQPLSPANSRRESEQSCISDYPVSECGGVRYLRTPSVVVSDYSDDVMCGISLEEIEYFRSHRMHRRRSSMDAAGIGPGDKDGEVLSDISASSSCSNLYYCGSTISALDGGECYVNGIRMQLERKASDCSTTGSASGDDDPYIIREQPVEEAAVVGNNDKDLVDLLAAHHLSTKRVKKVGGLRPVGEKGAVTGGPEGAGGLCVPDIQDEV